MSSRPPAFQFYPGDWLADFRVERLDLEEEGAYHRLLSYMWRDAPDQCSWPKDEGVLAKLWKHCSIRKARQLLASLQDASGPVFLEEKRRGITYLVSKRLRKEAIRLADLREDRSEAGKLGAAKRWQAHGKRHEAATVLPMANDSALSSDFELQASIKQPPKPPKGGGDVSPVDNPSPAIGYFEGKLGRSLTDDETKSVKRWVRVFGSAATCSAIGASFEVDVQDRLAYIGGTLRDRAKEEA